MTVRHDIEALQRAWIQRFHPPVPDAALLVCFPYAGGSASYYHPMSRALAGRAEVVAVQYPGRQARSRERCIDDVDTLADEIATVLAPWAGRSLVFFGHSMGAVVGFEVAARLERDTGTALAALFVSGRRAPVTTRDETVHLRGDAAILDDVRTLDGAAVALLDDEEIRGMVMPALRADYRAIERYRYRSWPRLRCPVTAFTGDADPKTTVEEMRRWREHTDASFDLRVFPGGHFFLDEPRNAAAVVGTVGETLDRVAP